MYPFADNYKVTRIKKKFPLMETQVPEGEISYPRYYVETESGHRFRVSELRYNLIEVGALYRLDMFSKLHGGWRYLLANPVTEETPPRDPEIIRAEALKLLPWVRRYIEDKEGYIKPYRRYTEKVDPEQLAKDIKQASNTSFLPKSTVAYLELRRETERLEKEFAKR